LQTWEYDRVDGAQVENETDCFEMEPTYEFKVGPGVRLMSMVRTPGQQTIWFAQVSQSFQLARDCCKRHRPPLSSVSVSVCIPLCPRVCLSAARG